MNWEVIRAGWSTGWKALETSALQKYQAAIEASPEQFRDVVTTVLSDLGTTRAHLLHIQMLLNDPVATAVDRQKFKEFEERYQTLGAGIYAHAKPIEDGVEGPPIVAALIIGVIIIGIVGIAWSIVGYQYTTNLREQTALMDRDLTERSAASREGRTLQPSTVDIPKPDDDDDESGDGMGLLLLGGLTVLAGVLTVPLLMNKKGTKS